MADLTGPNPDEVGGDVAHDATDSGMPVKMGGYASAAAPSAVSGDGDRVNLWLSRFGAANVILRDTSGAAIATGTQYTENAVITADAGVGTLVVGRRDDALTTLTPAENDAVGLRVGDKGALWVQIADGSGAQVTSFGGGTQYVEDVAMGATPTGTLAVGVGSTALPSAVSADGDAVGLWATLNGALNVVLRSAAGTAVDTTGDILGVRIDTASDPIFLGGGNTAHDDPATTVDPLLMGAYASAAAPTSVSTDVDAVRLWALRNGSLVVNLASGGTLLTIGQKTAANSFPVVLPSDGYGSGATAAMHVVLGTGTADYTLFGQAAASAPFTRLTDATTTVGVIAGTTALKTDTSSIAGTAAVTSGVNGLLGVGGGLAHDTAAAAMYPVGIGAFASVAAPADVSADGDVVKLWALRNGSQVVNLAAGGTLWTNMGQAAASGQFVRLTNGTLTASLLDLTNSDPLAVAIVDGSGTQVTSFGGGTQYVEDVALGAVGSATGTLSIGRASVAAPTSVGADADAVGLWASRFGALNVIIRDTSGAAVSTGLQYVGDAVATATPTGTMVMGLANAAAPSDVSANADAVAAWMLRNGSQVVNLASGGTLVTIGQKAMASSLPVVLPSDGVLADATHPGYARMTDGTTAYAKTGQTAATAAFAQLSDQTTAVNVIAGTNALKTDLSSVAGTATVTGGVAGSQGVGGLAAHAAAASGNPVFIGGRASAVIPTDVGADGDVAAMWTNRNGAQVITAAPHVGLNGDPWSLVHEAAQYTSTQTSTVLVAGGGSEKIVVTKVQIQAYGTTAFDMQLYFGTAAFTRGTSRAVFDGRFVPSATSAPGVVMDGPFIAGTNGDDLMVTTSAAGSVTINVWYYLVT